MSEDEPTTKVPPELDAAIDAVFAYGPSKRKRGRARDDLLDEPLGRSPSLG